MADQNSFQAQRDARLQETLRRLEKDIVPAATTDRTNAKDSRLQEAADKALRAELWKNPRKYVDPNDPNKGWYNLMEMPDGRMFWMWYGWEGMPEVAYDPTGKLPVGATVLPKGYEDWPDGYDPDSKLTYARIPDTFEDLRYEQRLGDMQRDRQMTRDEAIGVYNATQAGRKSQDITENKKARPLAYASEAEAKYALERSVRDDAGYNTDDMRKEAIADQLSQKRDGTPEPWFKIHGQEGHARRLANEQALQEAEKKVAAQRARGQEE